MTFLRSSMPSLRTIGRLFSTTRYTKSHEWVRFEDKAKAIAAVGVTDFAQSALGDVVFVDLPDVNTAVNAGKPFGAIESVKSASDLYSPVSGTVTAVNEAVKASTELVNKSAENDAWLIKIKVANPADVEKLMDAAAYQQFLKEH